MVIKTKQNLYQIKKTTNFRPSAFYLCFYTRPQCMLINKIHKKYYLFKSCVGHIIRSWNVNNNCRLSVWMEWSVQECVLNWSFYKSHCCCTKMPATCGGPCSGVVYRRLPAGWCTGDYNGELCELHFNNYFASKKSVWAPSWDTVATVCV